MLTDYKAQKSSFFFLIEVSTESKYIFLSVKASSNKLSVRLTNLTHLKLL